VDLDGVIYSVTNAVMVLAENPVRLADQGAEGVKVPAL